MNCPKCGAWSTVLETRKGEHHTTRRKRQCANGHRFYTTEIHNAAYGSVKPRLAVFSRTIAVRVAKQKRNAAIRKRLSAGERATDLAAEYRLTKSAITWIKKGS